MSTPLDPAEAENERGNALRNAGNAQEALACYDQAITLRPTYPEAWSNRGNALKDLGRLDEALASYDRALALRPDYPNALSNRGGALKDLGRLQEALESYDRAVALQPDHSAALNNRGNALLALERVHEALASYDLAVSVRPDYALAWMNRGSALLRIHAHREALASADRAIALHPDLDEAWHIRGNALMELKQPDEALACFEHVLQLAPDHLHAFNDMAFAALRACDWGRLEKCAASIVGRVSSSTTLIQPMVLAGFDCPPEAELACATRFFAARVVQAAPLWRGEPYSHPRIRLAYLSADFRTHPVASLGAELFELHDRSRFEVTAISFGADDRSELRLRLEKAFDRFEDVRFKSESEIAKLIREREIDIAVDLNGYTHNARLGILAHRPAPVQVNYLGYPGTMGAPHWDYILADPVIAPFEHQPAYSERIVHLPDSYMPGDSQRAIADRPMQRSEVGLPAAGFVFCCFNATWKLTPGLFDIWMRIMRDTPGSVLWLTSDSDAARRNLCAEAEKRGVPASRLVFTTKLPYDEHLARHRLADLFLDTLPYNAHTTASEALWAGLPMVTCMSERFQGRVGASLLKAAGLPELVATSLDDYDRLIRRLVAEPALLAGFRARLAQSRLTCPAFDTPRYVRHIEAAYEQMVETARSGDTPKSFAVPAG